MGDVNLLAEPTLPIPPELRAALLKGYRAFASSDSGARAAAVQALASLPEDQQWSSVPKLLAQLGANHEAFQMASRIASGGDPGPALFWDRRMRGTLDDPGFPALATQLGLFKYWATTHTKPD